jgi:hypothetical protein
MSMKMITSLITATMMIMAVGGAAQAGQPKSVKTLGKVKPVKILGKVKPVKILGKVKPVKILGKVKPKDGTPTKPDPAKPDPAKPDPAKPGTGGKGKGEGKDKGEHAGKWPKGPWVYGGHQPHIVEYAPSRRTTAASPVAQAAPSTDPVCVQGTWAEQEEKKVYVCLSWYFRGRLMTPDQLAQVLAQQ